MAYGLRFFWALWIDTMNRPFGLEVEQSWLTVR